MWSKWRPRSAYDVMAAIGLFLAVATGSSYAIDRIDSGDITDNSIRSVDLRNNDVKAADLASGAVRGAEIRNGAIRSADVAQGGIAGADVANESLTGADVGGLTGLDVAADSLTSVDVAGLTGVDLLGNSLTGAQIADDSLSGADVGGLTGGDIVGDSLTGAQIDDLTGADIADDSVPDEKLENVKTSDGVTKLGPGENAVLIEEEPFIVRGTCTDDGAGSFISEVTVETTEDGSVWNSPVGGSGLLPVGETRQIVNADDAEVEIKGETFMLAAPSGTMVTGYAGAGINALGTPCFTLATALKG